MSAIDPQEFGRLEAKVEALEKFPIPARTLVLLAGVAAVLLPSSGTHTETVTIADGRPDTQVNYADVICSTQAINAPGGYAPT